MKLTGLFLVAAFLHVSAGTTAQRLSISVKNSPLEKLFSEIEKKTNYVFFYDATLLQRTKPVTVEMKDASVEEVLSVSLKGQGLSFAIQGRTIFVKRDAAKAIAVASGPGDGKDPASVSGEVRSEDGLPLAGASVYIRKLKIMGVTNAQGVFVLKNVPDGEYEVEISYVGFELYKTKVTVVNHGGVVTAKLKQSMSKLDETQVIAYGTTSQRLSTGDITTVTSKEIQNQPIANPLAALEGRVPGLLVSQTSGIPGGAYAIQIRGQNSMINGNDPFYVIDGVPYPSQTVSIINPILSGNHYLYGYNNSGGNPLNYINPSDIESISILKDADATSIYGSRAANGAILITTKKGQVGAARVDVNVYSGVGQVTRKMNLMNTQQYLTMRHEAFLNDKATPNPNSDYDLTAWDTSRNTDWQKVLIGNTAHYNDAQASVSGGNEYTQYFIGGGYHRETTVYPGTNANQKASAHVNITSLSLNKKFKLMLTAGYVADMSNIPTSDLTSSALYLAPDAPALYKSDGTLNWAALSPGQIGTWTNPLVYLLTGYKGRTKNLISNSVISYIVIPGLAISANVGYTSTQTSEIITNPTTASDPGYKIASGYAQFNGTNASSWIIEPQASYSKRIGKGMLKALFGTTFQENAIDGRSFYATGFSSDALLQDMQAATSITVQSDINTVYKYNALFGRLSYNWEDKYLLDINARRDGSSRFGPGSQFANFASIGGAWIFSKEDFIKDLFPFLSFGKLRASYGTSGNDQIGDYRFLDLYSATRYPYQNTQGLFPANLFNPNLAWELNKKLEGSISLGFLKDRIMVDANYYVNRSNNQLVTSPLSAVTGFNSIAANLSAVVQNSGFELALNTNNIHSKDWGWSSSLNLTLPENKLISFPGLTTSSYKSIYVIGKPITIMRAYRFNGVNDSAGIYQFLDAKGGNTFRPSYSTDQTVWTDIAPEYYGGFSNSIRYKGFELDILFQFVKQKAKNIIPYTNFPPGFGGNNQPTAVLNRWQKPGDVKPYERFTQSYSSAYTQYANYYRNLSEAIYSDASFIRLRNVGLSYSPAASWVHRIHVQKCNVYVRGQNLLTFTKYFGLDPETQGNALPPLRVWVAGIQLVF